MPLVITPESELGKELARWNTPRNQFVRDSNGDILKGQDGQPIRGMNCVGIEPYPRMMYRAHRLPNGQASATEMPPHPAYCIDDKDYERKSLFVETFNRQCQRIVHNQDQELIAKGQGWAYTTNQAMEIYEKEQQAIAHAAAQAEFYAKKMSAKAQREFQAAHDDTSEHVVDVKPKRRGRKPKAVAPMDPAAGEE